MHWGHTFWKLRIFDLSVFRKTILFPSQSGFKLPNMSPRTRGDPCGEGHQHGMVHHKRYSEIFSNVLYLDPPKNAEKCAPKATLEVNAASDFCKKRHGFQIKNICFFVLFGFFLGKTLTSKLCDLEDLWPPTFLGCEFWLNFSPSSNSGWGSSVFPAKIFLATTLHYRVWKTPPEMECIFWFFFRPDFFLRERSRFQYHFQSSVSPKKATFHSFRIVYPPFDFSKE